MDFEIKIGPEGTPIRFTQFDDLVEFIKTYLAQWNNFNPEMNFDIYVKKVPNDTPTIGIHTGDGVHVKDIFGQR